MNTVHVSMYVPIDIYRYNGSMVHLMHQTSDGPRGGYLVGSVWLGLNLMIPLEKPSIETIETLRSEVASEGKCMVNAGQTKEIAQRKSEQNSIEFRKQIGGIWWVFSTSNFHKKRPNPPPFH
jgi:hypothetical protein